LYQTEKQGEKKMGYELAHDALHVPGCKGNTKLVLIALADCCNFRTGKCFPSHSTIAETIGSDRGTVVRAIAQLESLGYITCAGKHGSSLNYKLNIPQARDPVSCGKNQQVEMLGNNTKMLENTTGSVVKSNTNKESNIEIKKEKNNASKAKVIKSTAIIKQDAACQLTTTTTTKLIPKQEGIYSEAKRRLIGEGMSEAEAENLLKEIKDEFVTKARWLKANGELEKKKSPQRYLVGMLASMAKEGPKKAAVVECESRKLDDILVKLREVYKGIYPDVVDRIDRILTVDNINHYTMEFLRSQEVQNWQGKSSPLEYVKSKLDGWMYGQVRQARDCEYSELSADLQRMRRRIGEKEYYWQEMKKQGTNKFELNDIDCQIKKLNTNISRAVARLHEIDNMRK
jgi:hypothetical protein